MRNGVKVGVFVALASCACTLLTSLDGLTGGAEERPGQKDVETFDADASAETGGRAGDADAGAWCATFGKDAAFCDDFDDDGLARMKVTASDAGRVSLDTAFARSLPNSAYVRRPAGDAGSGGSLGVSFGLATYGEGAFDLYIGRASTLPCRMELSKLYFTYAVTEDWALGLSIDQNRTLRVFTYGSQTGYTDVRIVGPVAADVWTRIRYDVTLNGAGVATANVVIDETRGATNVTASTPISSGTLSLYFGAMAPNQPHDGWDFHFDNVTLDGR